MQTKNKKKGFTLVELVIVVAVIAVLSAILIPTIGCFVEDAKETSDMTTVKTLNTALVRYEAENGKPETMDEVLTIMAGLGYNVDRLTPLSTGDILWDSKNDRFALNDKDGKPVYRDNTTEEAQPIDLWMVAAKVADLQKSYSKYLKSDVDFGTELTVTTGLDVGSHSEIKVTYETATQQNVIIRTAGSELVIKAPASNVAHHGEASVVYLEDAATESYHEHGTAKIVVLTKGRIVLEKGSNVGRIHLNNSASGYSADNAIIALSDGVTLPTVSIAEADTGNVAKLVSTNGESYITGENAGVVDIDNEIVIANCEHAELDYTSVSETEHKAVCRKCKYEFTENHVMENGACAKCDYRKVIEVNALSDLASKREGKTFMDVKTGSYKLMADLASNEILIFSNGVEIDLNGHTITSTASYWSEYSNVAYTEVTFKNGNLVIDKSIDYIWNASQNEVVLNFVDVNIDASKASAAFRTQPYMEEHWLTINGGNFISNGTLILADPTYAIEGSSSISHIVFNNVKATTTKGELIKLNAIYQYDEIYAEFNGCTFISTAKSDAIIRTSLSKDNNNKIELTLNTCTLNSSCNKYLYDYDATREDIKVSFIKCTDQNNNTITLG